jgi:hypothetical protein
LFTFAIVVVPHLHFVKVFALSLLKNVRNDHIKGLLDVLVHIGAGLYVPEPVLPSEHLSLVAVHLSVFLKIAFVPY